MSLIHENTHLEAGSQAEGVKKFDEKLKNDSFDASANYYMARYLLALSRPNDALPYIKEAVALEFNNADYHYWLGVCYHRLKRYGEERQSYLRAIQYNNRHADAYLYLGHSYLESGKWEEALGAYDKVLEIDKDHLQAMYNRALALNKLQRFGVILPITSGCILPCLDWGIPGHSENTVLIYQSITITGQN